MARDRKSRIARVVTIALCFWRRWSFEEAQGS
jgi:hypothetical protein